MIDRGWKYHPAGRCVVSLAGGILLAHYTSPSAAMLLLCMALAFALLVHVALLGVPLCGIATMMTVVVSGSMLYSIHRHNGIPVMNDVAVEGVRLSGRLSSWPIPREEGYWFLLDVDSLAIRNSVVHGPIRMMVRVLRADTLLRVTDLHDGSTLDLVGRLSIPGPTTATYEFDRRAQLQRRRVAGVLTCGDDRELWIVERSSNGPLVALVDRARQGVRRFSHDVVGGEEGDLIRGLVLGERDDIDRSTTEAFRRTGTVHILSVSGMHVGVLLVLLFTVTSWISHRWVGLLLLSLALLFCLALTGGPPSILRAVVMAIAVAVARTSGRIVRPLNTLATAALAVLVINPTDLFDPGFQLSFASVAAIQLYHAPVIYAIRTLRWFGVRLLRYPIEMLVLSVSATIGTLPIVLSSIGYISWIGPVVNLVAIPLTSCALGAAVAGCFVMDLMPGVGEIFAASARLALTITLRIVTATGEWQWSGTAGLAPGGTAVALISLLSIWLAFGRNVVQGMIRGGCWLVAVVAVVATVPRVEIPSSGSGLLLLPHQGSTIAVEQSEGAVAAYYWSDRTTAERVRLVVSRLCDLSDIHGVRMVAIDSISDSTAGDLRRWNPRVAEMELVNTGVLLRGSAENEPGLVERRLKRYLRVDLGRELSGALVLRHVGDGFCAERFATCSGNN